MKCRIFTSKDAGRIMAIVLENFATTNPNLNKFFVKLLMGFDAEALVLWPMQEVSA